MAGFLEPIEDGVIIAQHKDGTYGAIGFEGNVVVPFVYGKMTGIFDGYALVQTKGLQVGILKIPAASQVQEPENAKWNRIHKQEQ